MVESNGRPVVNAPFHGAILSGERLNAPRGKYLLSSRRRKLDYLCFHKDDQTAYMTKYALAVGWLKVWTFSVSLDGRPGVILGSLFTLHPGCAMLCIGYDLIYTVTDGRYGWPRSHEPPVGQIGKSMPMSRRLNREWPGEAKGNRASILFALGQLPMCAYLDSR